MFSPEAYTIAATLFPRLLGLIYLAAFAPFLFQIKGLIGKNGVLPLGEFLRQIRLNYPKDYFQILPTIFWINSSNTCLMGAVISGTILSILLVLGIWPPLLLLLLYVLYLSIVTAGQEFLSFGWEGFLLEITINTFFLSLTTPPNLMIWISINLLLFRFHLQGGTVKLQSGDENWRNLTAVAYHYQSQPLPNTMAWYIHKFPMWFHKLSTLAMFIIEIAVPFAMFGNDVMRLGTFFGFFGLQSMIWLTGNFSYLNHMTAVFSIILVSNAYLSPFIAAPDETVQYWKGTDIICTVVGTMLTALQLMRLWQHFSPYPFAMFSRWLRNLGAFHLANQYGIFAIMTTIRNEIIFEGSHDGLEWKEYVFFYKPGETTHRPRRISPYQPRIDWQAWFLPLGHYRFDRWYTNFIYHLLKGTPEVLALIKTNPFPEAPPQFVRTVIYEYEFSSFQEKRKTGHWWQRKWIGIFSNPVRLADTN